MMKEPTLNVLLVEDNAGDARLLLELLKEDDSSDFEIHHAARLSEALQILNEHRAVPLFPVVIQNAMAEVIVKPAQYRRKICLFSLTRIKLTAVFSKPN